MKKCAFLCIFFVMSLSGCAALENMRQQWLAENCNVNAAYSNGLKNGLESGGMPNNYANSCAVNQEEIGRAYLRGFSKGLEGRPKEINVNQTVTNKNN